MGCAYGGSDWSADYKLEGVCAAQRPPPLPPEEVLRLLQSEKKFTAGSTDITIVDGLYRRFFDGVSRAATVLDFQQLGWGAREAQALAAVLPRFAKLEKIDLSKNKLDAAAASALVEGLRATASLTTLLLARNSLGAEGAKALAPAIAGSSSLTKLNVKFNNLGNDGKAALQDAVRSKKGFELIL